MSKCNAIGWIKVVVYFQMESVVVVRVEVKCKILIIDFFQRQIWKVKRLNYGNEYGKKIYLKEKICSLFYRFCLTSKLRHLFEQINKLLEKMQTK